MNNVMQSTIAVIHLVVRKQFVPIIKEHSIAHVVMDTLVTHIMKVVAWHSNVKVMPIVQQVPNVFNQIVNQNVEMFVKMSAVDRIPIVRQLIMLVFVNVYLDMVVKRQIQLLVADHCQFHVHCLQNVQPIHIAIAVFVNQHVF